MENNEINIAAILKDTPRDTQLFCPWLGNVWFSNVEENGAIRFKPEWGTGYAVRKDGTAFDGGDVQIFPSKYMRDWNKFAWKKGDVLLCGVDNLCIFDSWANDSYTEFYGRYSSQNYSIEADKLDTEGWTKVTNTFAINNFISKINEFHNGNLIRSTLEIKKWQELEVGVFYYIEGRNNERAIAKLEKRNADSYVFGDYVAWKAGNESEKEFYHKCGKPTDKTSILMIRPATTSELMDFRFTKGSRTFSAFDKVLVRNVDCNSIWHPAFFLRMKNESRYMYYCKELDEARADEYCHCIPYEGNEHLAYTNESSEMDE